MKKSHTITMDNEVWKKLGTLKEIDGLSRSTRIEMLVRAEIKKIGVD